MTTINEKTPYIHLLADALCVDIDEAERVYEIHSRLSYLEKICDQYVVLNNEAYGSEALAYNVDEVPTNREFWTECGMNADEIESPDERVPTVPLSQYLEDDRIDRPIFADSHTFIPGRIREIVSEIESLRENDGVTETVEEV